MICFDINDPLILRGAAVALGNFDGLHLGHMALIHELTAKAARRGLMSLAFMFSEHPRNVLNGDGHTKLLMDNSQKCDILVRTALDGVCFAKFDAQFANMLPEDFVRRVLVERLGARLIVAGFNYRFGRRNAASVKDLAALGAKHGAEVVVVKPYVVGQAVASSSAIRSLLEAGRVEEAPAMLGRVFSVRGVVQAGRRLGRTIGVPTANLACGARAVSPGQGVYATSAKIGGRLFRSLTSVGANPTVGALRCDVVETHVIEFGGDLYGKTLEVFFHKRLRDIQKFSGLDALRAQIQRDIAATRAYFGLHEFS